jgi:hypothetical protein
MSETTEELRKIAEEKLNRIAGLLAELDAKLVEKKKKGEHVDPKVLDLINETDVGLAQTYKMLTSE